MKKENGQLTISWLTEGASIGFKYSKDEQAWLGWRIYDAPFGFLRRGSVKIKVHRIGYKMSDTLKTGG